MTVTKQHVVNQVQQLTGLQRKSSQNVVESALEIIKNALAEGEDVLISGFGKFCVKDKDSRRGRNPHTGEELEITARRVVTFKCSSLLRNRVNEE